jgi:16S rRNA (cytidine1402-2'-O)-methyltransferase
MGSSAGSTGDAPSSGTLFVVGTPIGNVGDMTDRAREVLGSVDVIAAEDTRRTGRLLRTLGIAKPRMISLHDANERARTDELVHRLRHGAAIALVSDGGMPLVSDPGYRVVRAVSDEGIDVRVVPGPSAAIAALVVAGLPTDRWGFEGFLPKKAGERRRRLDAVAADDRTLVFFESPLRLRGLLTDVIAALGDRQVAMCRELTKLHEDVLRGRASEVLEALGDADPKGEVVLVVAGSRGEGRGDLASALAEASSLVGGGTKKREAARTVAARHGLHANDLYRALLDDAS